MVPSRVISEILNVEKCHDLEIRVRGHSMSLKVVPFYRLCMVCYYCPIVTLSIIRTVFEIFTFKRYCDLETGVRGSCFMFHIGVMTYFIPEGRGC